MHTGNDVPAYTYTALHSGEIRLLTPADDINGHAWNIEIVSLESTELAFDALSYTWGSQNETYPIVCNSHSMRVHHNLYLALPFLARRTASETSRPIWVDAVCINQTDDNEKRVQIQLMNTLYQRAKHVWVWLGCGAPEEQVHIPRAIALLPDIIEERNRRMTLANTWQKKEVAPSLQNLEPGVWKAIFYVLRNPWYQRVWIVQEAALAADMTFLCGEHKIDGKLLESAVWADLVSSWQASDIHGNPVKFNVPPSDNSTVFWIRSLVQEGITAFSLDTPSLMQRVTILMTGEHACFLPEDRVRGMLGLIHENELGATILDLHSCTTTQSLYTQFAAYVLLATDPFKTQFWWPFFNLSFTLARIPGLPSWVPDFHHQEKYTPQVCAQPRITDFEPKHKRYQASGQRATIKQGSHVGELVISGKMVDEICAVYPVPPKQNPIPNDDGRGMVTWMAEMARWEAELFAAIVCKDDDKTHTCRVSEEMYWSTLFTDDFVDGTSNTPITLETCRTYQQTMKEVRVLCDWHLENLARQASNLPPLSPIMSESVLAHIKPGTPASVIMCKLNFLGDRQVFLTTGGRLGFTMRGVCANDTVCVFDTATTPHVLRAQGRDWKVVGDAYIHGLMYGESDRFDIPVREIHLV